MEKLEQNLTQLKDLLKALTGLPTPSQPEAPKVPTLAPSSKKNPLKVAQQVQDKPVKKLAVKAAKNVLKIHKNGQWELG